MRWPRHEGSAPRLAPPSIALAAALAICACGGGRRTQEEPLPAALRPFSTGYEVTPFAGYTVDGVSLFRVAPTDDPNHASIVGVEARTGELLERASLFFRAAEDRSPEEQAVFAIDMLLARQGNTPLDASAPSIEETDRALIEPPTIDERTLRFFMPRDASSSEVARFDIGLGNGSVRIRPLRDLRAELPFCTPQLSCGCWSGCLLVRALDAQRVEVLAPNAGETRVLSRVCNPGNPPQCAQVCDASGQCREPYALLEEQCTQACPPSIAPFACERAGETCQGVEP